MLQLQQSWPHHVEVSKQGIVLRAEDAHDSTLERSGGVEGKYVKDILLDMGCSKTLVHHKLVPERKV